MWFRHAHTVKQNGSFIYEMVTSVAEQWRPKYYSHFAFDFKWVATRKHSGI